VLLFFDASCVTPPVPAGSNVDALYLDGGDTGPLVVSYDVLTTLGLPTFQPSALVRWTHTAPGPCGFPGFASLLPVSACQTASKA